MASLLQGLGYVPPGVYTETEFGDPPTPERVPDGIPLLIGVGNETLQRTDYALQRGSSSSADTLVTDEDETGRAVVSITPAGVPVLGSFDGTISRFRVRNYPLVTGDGSATVATAPSAVTVTIDDEPTVVLGLDGSTGVVEIADAPSATAVVRCTYYFDRADTQVTEDLSDQVTGERAVLDAATGQNYAFTAGVTDAFALSVDGLPSVTVTMPSTTAITAAVAAAAINGTAGIGSLTASTVLDNRGRTRLRLAADSSIVIGSGSANGVLGFENGQSSARNRVFYTNNGPIVTGSGDGRTTTNPGDLSVTVNGTAATVSSVDGATRAITLAAAPPVGATVSVTYWFNTWQDTFDYLPATGVTSIDRVAITPDAGTAGTYVGGSDYVLAQDRIVWGSAVLVTAVTPVTGQEFGTTKVSTSLTDERGFMEPCTEVTGSRTAFSLPFQPTTGDGRGNPLGSETWTTVANGRSALPTNQTALVTAYWGYGVTDALERGPVTVLRVENDSAQIVLAEPVPVGATVYATQYYSNLVDAAFLGTGRGYTLTCVTPGPSGTGTYSVTGPSGSLLYAGTLAGKSAGLNTVTLAFPSGSEFLPDFRIEGGAPTEETVTVEFAQSSTTPARYAFPGAGPYYLVNGSSSRLRVTIDGVAGSTGGATGINLANATAGTRVGGFAHLLGNEVQYDEDSGQTTYEVEAGVNDTVNLLVDGVPIAATVAAGTRTLADFAAAINAAAVGAGQEPFILSSGAFLSGMTVTVNQYDNLTLHYTGNVSGPSAGQTITLTPGVYATAALLAAEINAQLATINGAGGLNGSVTCAATSEGRLKFTLTRDPGDASGYLEFLTDGTPARDFAILAGLDASAAANNDQTKLYHGPIAALYTATSTGGRLPYDRLVIRNRIFVGGGSVSFWVAQNQCQLISQGGTGYLLAGLPSGLTGEAAYGATVKGPTLTGTVGWAGGIATGFVDARDSQPLVTFYDGTGTEGANDTLILLLNSTVVTVAFTSSSGGTATALGPVGTTTSVLGQIAAALVGTGYSVVQEGDSFRIYGTSASAQVPEASAVVGDGSANEILGLVEDTSSGIAPVTPGQVASTLMNHVQTFATWILNPATVGVGYFASRALAGVVTDGTGAQYLYLQSRTLGAASSILLADASSANALALDSALGALAGDGAEGEAAAEGFFVTSTNPGSGSGSANTSVFNSGVGQDGYVGQTYRDAVTGLTFTILERAGGVPYPVGESFTIRVSRTVVTNSSIPVKAIPGVEMIVANTIGVTAGDRGRVETFARGGSEPAVGETYYVTFTYTKRLGRPPLIYTGVDQINLAFGADSPIGVAAEIMFDNGPAAIAVYQVPKTAGSASASEQAYIDALDAIKGPCLPGEVSPRVIVPLTPATVRLAQQYARHCDTQSSVAARAERTANFGFRAGIRADEAATIVAAAGSTLVRFLYPDILTFSRTDAFGRRTTTTLDGPYAAAAVAAARFSPDKDAATPWEDMSIFGFDGLARRVDSTLANSLAARGITVLTDVGGGVLRVRQGLTSNRSNALLANPTTAEIAAEVHRRQRATLAPFTGKKFFPQTLTSVESNFGATMRKLVKDGIITAYRNVKVQVDPTDPLAIEVTCEYSPVLPLLFVTIRFRVRSSL